jgi:hypothetical protein
MNESETTRRTDAELITIIDENVAWSVRDEFGTVVEWAASLRGALAIVADVEREGRKIVALSQGQDDRIIVFRGQIERLRAAAGE